ncbi:MAG: thiol reductant ABC exporter subunit CydD [Pseudomonadota bacterium]
MAVATTDPASDGTTPQAARPAKAGTDDLGQLDREARRWLRANAGPGQGAQRLAAAIGVVAGLLAIPQSYVLAVLLSAAVVPTLNVIPPEPPVPVLPLLAVFAGIIGLRAGLLWAQTTAGHRAAIAVKQTLRMRLIDRLSRTAPADRGAMPAGGLASQLVDQVEALEGYYGRYQPLTLVTAIVPLGIALSAFFFSQAVGLVLVGAAVALPLLMALVGLGAAKKSAAQFDTLTRMSGYFLDRLRGLPTLRIFGEAEAELGRIRTMANEFRYRTLSVLRLAFLTSTALELVSAISIAVVALMVGSHVLMGGTGSAAMPVATALFLLILTPEFFAPFRHLSAAYHDRMLAIGAAKSLSALEALPARGVAAAPPRPATARPKSPDVAFEQVSLSYGTDKGRRQALSDLTFRAEPNKLTALMGPSGVGKTSVFTLLLGFAEQDSGAIHVGEQPLADLHAMGLTGTVSWVGQRAHLIPGTVADNLRLGHPQADDTALWSALTEVGLADRLRRAPDGLNTPVGERDLGFSGGEAQRIAVARALLSPARLMLMDEPTAHLDRENEAIVLEVLRSLKGKRTLLVATHSAAVAGAADHVVFMAPAKSPPLSGSGEAGR